MASIRGARHYQKPDAPVRLIALRGRAPLKRVLRSALPHLRSVFDRGKALHLLRHGRVREMSDAVDWHHFRNVLKAVFEKWALVYEEAAALGARKINGSFHSKRRRVRFRKSGNIIEFYKEAGHDVSDEPRDEHGQWTTGGGGGAPTSEGRGMTGPRWSGNEGSPIARQWAKESSAAGLTSRFNPKTDGNPTVYHGIKEGHQREGFAFVTRDQAGAAFHGEAQGYKIRPGAKIHADMEEGSGKTGRETLLTGPASSSSGIIHFHDLIPTMHKGFEKAIGDRFTFDRFDDAAQARLKDAQDELIQQLESGARDTIRAVVLRGQQLGLSPADTVDDIWSVIDLTDRQAVAVMNYENMLRNLDGDALRRQLRADDMDATVRNAIENGVDLDEAVIGELVDAYEANYLEYRAETIAQTESVRAANWGLHDAYSQAIERGALPDEAVKRFWQLGDHPCPVCESIPDANPEGVGVDEDFDSDDGPQDDAPVHPNCMCSVEYVVDLSLVPDDDGEEE